MHAKCLTQQHSPSSLRGLGRKTELLRLWWKQTSAGLISSMERITKSLLDRQDASGSLQHSLKRLRCDQGRLSCSHTGLTSRSKQLAEKGPVVHGFVLLWLKVCEFQNNNKKNFCSPLTSPHWTLLGNISECNTITPNDLVKPQTDKWLAKCHTALGDRVAGRPQEPQ